MRSGCRGVTLIECLMALIVIAIGLVGIVSMYPVAIGTSKKSLEIAEAAKYAESIRHALEAALKNAVYDPTTQQWKITLTHDMTDGTNANRIDIDLPKIDDGWRRFPGNKPVAPSKNPRKKPGPFERPQNDAAYNLYADRWIRSQVDYVRKTSDASDPYAQFAFSFDVKKINTLSHLRNPPPDLERQTGLYRFRIHVFRTGKQVPVGGETIVIAPAGEEKNYLTMITAEISVR